MRVFSGLSAQIATTQLEKGLTSDAVLAKIAPSLVKLGFEVESGKSAKDKVERLATAIREVMQDLDTQRKFTDAKMTPIVNTQAQTVAMLKAYRAQWAPVVQKSGYQP